MAPWRTLPGCSCGSETAKLIVPRVCYVDADLRMVGSGCSGVLAPSSLSAAPSDSNWGLLRCLHVPFALKIPNSLVRRQVADAEELYRLKGVRALVRIASAATVLGHIPLANGERVLALFTYSGSALETDWQADLGQPIETSIASFAITSEML